MQNKFELEIPEEVLHRDGTLARGLFNIEQHEAAAQRAVQATEAQRTPEAATQTEPQAPNSYQGDDELARKRTHVQERIDATHRMANARGMIDELGIPA